jgi:hypothetical protein
VLLWDCDTCFYDNGIRRGEYKKKISVALFIGFISYMWFDTKYPVCYALFHSRNQILFRMTLDYFEIFTVCVNKPFVHAIEGNKLPKISHPLFNNRAAILDPFWTLFPAFNNCLHRDNEQLLPWSAEVKNLWTCATVSYTFVTRSIKDMDNFAFPQRICLLNASCFKCYAETNTETFITANELHPKWDTIVPPPVAKYLFPMPVKWHPFLIITRFPRKINSPQYTSLEIPTCLATQVYLYVCALIYQFCRIYEYVTY